MAPLLKRKSTALLEQEQIMVKKQSIVSREAPMSEQDDSSDPESEVESVVEAEHDIVNRLVEEDVSLDRDHAAQKAKRLYKMPTADEIHDLKVTEELYKSNVFKWQMDAMLNEVLLRQDKCAPLEKMFWKLKELFANVQDQPETNLPHVVAHLQKTYGITIPFPNPQPNLEQIKYTFGFRKPSAVRIVGSYMLRTMVKGRTGGLNADMAVEMPSSIFQEKDFMNYRYYYKRAYYVAMLAAELQRNAEDLGINVEFGTLNNDIRKPILLVRHDPKSEASRELDFSKCTIRIIPCLNENTFLAGRLAPARNSIRTKGQQDESTTIYPTPRYNNGILVDTLYAHHMSFLYTWIKSSEEKAAGAFKDACMLLKVWLRQRGLDSCQSNGINGFLLNMMMAWLHTDCEEGHSRLSSMWSSYQLFRVTLEWIAGRDLVAESIDMSNGKLSEQDGFSLNEFRKHYDVVIVDPSGHVNLAADVTRSDWECLRHEARISCSVLHEQSSDDQFDLVFLKNISQPLYRFDNLCFIKECPLTVPLISKGKQIDFGTSPRALAFAVEALLRKAIGSRFKTIFVSSEPVAAWDLNTKCSQVDTMTVNLTIGLLLDSEESQRLVEQGPLAEDEAATKEFRLIWGDKAELRRFKDGSIVESVIWECLKEDGPLGRASVVERAVSFLLKRHLRLRNDNQIVYIGNQPYTLLKPARSCLKPYIFAFQPVITAFDQFKKQITDLGDEMPLTIAEVRPAHPALRYSSAALPQPIQIQDHNGYLEPIDVVLDLESSGKWPSDLVAIQKTKAAFYIKIAELFEAAVPGSVVNICRGEYTQNDPEGISMNAAGYLEITPPSGFTYRCRLHHNLELTLLQQKMLHPDISPAAKEQTQLAIDLYEHHFIQVPLLTQFIQSLVHRFPAYSPTVRLLKLWLASHWLMCDSTQTNGNLPLGVHFPDEVVEVLCAKVFVSPEPYSVPACGWSGFVRALSLLVHWNWKDQPLFVEMHEKAASHDVSQRVVAAFKQLRSQDPMGRHSAMFIVPVNKPLENEAFSNDLASLHLLWQTSRWTKHGPSAMILQRAQKLALASLRSLEGMLNGEALTKSDMTSRFLQLFHHDTRCYDLIIHMKASACTRRYENVFKIDRHDKTVEPSEPQFKNLKPLNRTEPCLSSEQVLDATFNPMAEYLRDLQSAFGDSLLFFQNRCGGTSIGVLFNPSVYSTPRPFKVNCDFNFMPVEDKPKQKKQKPFVVGNLKAVVDTLQVLGEGFIDRVEIAERMNKTFTE